MAPPSSDEDPGQDQTEQRSSERYQPGEFARALQKAKHGDSSGFASLFEKFNRTVGALVRSQGSPDPEETVNIVFSKAFRSIDRFVGDESNFASFLYQTARFQCIDERRAVSREVRLTGEASSHAIKNNGSGDTREQSAIAARVNEALEALTSEQREVVVLRVFFGLTGPETAHALEQPITAIRSLQNRAETRMRVLVDSRVVKL